MNNYQVLFQFTEMIDSLFEQYREVAYRSPGACNAVDILEAPEIKDLVQEVCAFRNIHGPLPEHIIKADQLEMMLIWSRPKVFVDEVKKEANRLHLLDRFAKNKRDRKRKNNLAAASVLFLMVFVSAAGVNSYNHDSVAKNTVTEGVVVYKDQATGNQIASEVPGIESAKAAVMQEQETGIIVRAERWQVGSEWTYFAVSSTLGDSLFVSTTPNSPKSNSSKKLFLFIGNFGQDIVAAVESGTAEFLGTEKEIIDGVPVVFNKWKIRHPEVDGAVLFWAWDLPTHLPEKQQAH